MDRQRAAAVLLLAGVTLLGAGCIDGVRDAVGANPSHAWEAQAVVVEDVNPQDSLTSGALPSETREATFSLPVGVTDLRMSLDVEVPSAGNVTVTLSNPSETVYERGFSASGEDAYQTADPETGEWAVETVLRGEAAVEVRVDARVPVD